MYTDYYVLVQVTTKQKLPKKCRLTNMQKYLDKSPPVICKNYRRNLDQTN